MSKYLIYRGWKFRMIATGTLLESEEHGIQLRLDFRDWRRCKGFIDTLELNLDNDINGIT